MKLLVDMNLSPRWVEWLARSAVEAAHWSKLGPPEASDREIMAFAAAHDWIVLTHDLDFSAILAASKDSKPSVVQIRSDNLDPDVIGAAVIAAVRELREVLLAGALVSVEPHRTRSRVLPLRPTNL